VNLTLRRIHDTSDHTVGLLQLGIHVFTTLEDAFHIPKIAGKTRIPHGTYEIDLRTTSPMAAKYAERYGKKHRGMMWLKNVPNFDYVYIHVGNDEDDTEGCILVGRTLDPQKGFIGESVNAYKELYPLVMAALERNERVTLTITDQFT
jgi:hypothetical protein